MRLADAIKGRVSRQNIVNPVTDEVIVRENEMITPTIARKIEELGLERVFYHTYASGSRLKRIGGVNPPRSLYTDLPRQFCFRLTHNGPGFILKHGANDRDRKLRELFIDPETTWFVQDFEL